jgi:hypothetical protein
LSLWEIQADIVDWAIDMSIAVSFLNALEAVMAWENFHAMRLRWESRRFLKLPLALEGFRTKVNSQRWNRFRLPSDDDHDDEAQGRVVRFWNPEERCYYYRLKKYQT